MITLFVLSTIINTTQSPLFAQLFPSFFLPLLALYSIARFIYNNYHGFVFWI